MDAAECISDRVKLKKNDKWNSSSKIPHNQSKSMSAWEREF